MALKIQDDTKLQEYLARASLEAEKLREGLMSNPVTVTKANVDEQMKQLDALVDAINSYITENPEVKIRLGGEDTAFMLKPELKTPEKKFGDYSKAYYESAAGAVTLLTKFRDQFKESMKKDDPTPEDQNVMAQFHHWMDNVFTGLHWKYANKDASDDVENTAWKFKDTGVPASQAFYAARTSVEELPQLDLSAVAEENKPKENQPKEVKAKENKIQKKEASMVPPSLFKDSKSKQNFLFDKAISFNAKDASRFIYETFSVPADASNKISDDMVKNRKEFIKNCNIQTRLLDGGKPANSIEQIKNIQCMLVETNIDNNELKAAKMEITTDKATHEVWLGKNSVEAVGNNLCPAVYAVMAEAVKAQIYSQYQQGVEDKIGQAETDEISDKQVIEIAASGVSAEQLIESSLALVNAELIPVFPENVAPDFLTRFAQRLNEEQIAKLEDTKSSLSPAKQAEIAPLIEAVKVQKNQLAEAKKDATISFSNDPNPDKGIPNKVM